MTDQRAVILDVVHGLLEIHLGGGRRLAKCILLRTAQWALDMRQEVPSADELAESRPTMAHQMIEARTEATSRYRAADPSAAMAFRPRSLIIQQGLPGLASNPSVVRHGVDFALTSPPYPGVYVNYHRWKLGGRLEVPLPYFIAGQQDGHGLARLHHVCT